ncbi:neogenin isoform X2 [Nasonia vitripennis]|uniref:Neogenin n=1 Tax=Nasonia vitripennis TaxID=7425 RepID=A0A7M7HAC2_NASVI|nr:neogenin isoform X2 [Nasonia vitripennis]
MEQPTRRLRLLALLLLTIAAQLARAGAPGLQFSHEPEDLVLELGKSARLDCEAKIEATPGGLLQDLPVITWRTEDGQPINFIGDKYRSQLENGSLYISAANQESIGSYQCVASIENVGAIASRTAVVKLASLPGFDREPQDTMVYPGQIAYLSCKLATSDQVNIQWLKDEQPLLLDESRMTILPSGALEIDEVLPGDVGSYRCNASGFGQYRLSTKAQLALQTSDIGEGESMPVFVAKPFNQVAIEKSTITLECAANGNPKPEVYWLKDGTSIDLASLDSRYQTVAASSLMIKDVTEEDNGSYQCRAKNDIDTLDAVAEVVVQVPPRFIKRPQDKEASEHQELEFECEIYGKPPPLITWLKNGEVIKLSNYWQLTNGYNLKINGLLNIDAGIFQCMGTNPAGSVQASARLTIHQPKRKGPGRHRSANGKPVCKKRLSHKVLSNSTWQHPSTLLGHTSSAYTPNPPLSISPSDDPADLLSGPFARLPVSSFKDDELPYDPPYDPVAAAAVSDSLDGSGGLGEAGTLPLAPRNLSIGLVNSRFVALRWQEPEITSGEISNYLIYYKQEGFERERIERTPREETTVTISGLQPGTTYLFRAVANVSNVLSASSKVLELTTESEPNVPSHPLNLRGWPTSSQSIMLSWEEPTTTNGRISGYLITYAEGDYEELNRNTTNTSYELTGLKPYREYNIWVQAINDNGPGASTSEIRVRTFGDVPSNPPNVTIEAGGATSIVIRWEPPSEGQNGIITGYKIRYRPTDRRIHSSLITTDGNARYYVLNRLQKNISYQVRVCAFNVNGTGPTGCSEWQEVETYENDLSESDVPSAPTNLKTNPMSDSIDVRWGPPKNQSIKVRGYVLTWGKGIPDEYKKVLDGKQRYYQIDNLEPNSDYVITLRAKNEAGEGLQVYENVRTTEKTSAESAAPLTPPVGLKTVVMSSSTVVLHWTDSKNQHVTDNRYYIVRYTSYHRSSNQRYKYYNTTDLNCMIHDLKPNTEYEFTVKVVKGRRESPWSMVVMNKTLEAKPSSPPRDLTVQSIDEYPKSVLLRWLPPKLSNGDINGYIIRYTTDNNKDERDWKTEAFVGDKTEFVLPAELQPSTTYYFKIGARNAKGYGPFSSTVPYRTLKSSGGLSHMLIYIIVGCSVLVLTGVSVVFVFVCCRRSPDSPDGKKGYLKDTNIKTNIKPPDLWIHHDQMELKALEKTLGNGEASTSAITSNTLPRSGNSEYNQESAHGNSGSLDKRTYIPSYMGNNEDKCSTLSRQHSRGSHKPKLITLPVDSAPLHQPIATATPIVNSSMSQQTIHSSCSDVPSIRQNYPRSVAQYSLSRAHITLEPTPESSPDSCNLTSTYEALQTQLYTSGGPQSYNATSQYAPNSYGESGQPANSTTNSESNGGAKRLQGHPLKSFSVPAPPPQSAPSTPAQQKHGVSQVTVRPTISGSPYKKASGSSQLIKNRLASVANANHTPEEIERLKPSYSTEELNQEMANLEGLMKDLNAITASEFEC